MLINNSVHYMMLMNEKLPLVLDDVMKELLQKLQEIIDTNVYSYQSQGGWHGRTYQFRNSWTVNVPSMIDGWITSQIDNQGYNFTWNRMKDMWSHGNSRVPVRSNSDFNEIIDDRDGESNFGFPALKRPYWDEFLWYCDTSIPSLFKKHCLRHGVPVEMASVFYDFS